ncbi:Type VI secretion system baseplate subunit TssG [Sulfidibacter corallicola]|uniref:Type VI secretion system baseplate subunit TssG n=1 Tax=Sulfidibacter corallicola TaxID=2818388 RepID=A0A8A4TVI7_SULCO|nr:type VI secretion system baseplate subunit TssG [Sulfidibacter corallicola]QTD53377.1 type VI secretion system baseplate subunit TssG [Sulfidibacter corallicola]
MRNLTLLLHQLRCIAKESETSGKPMRLTQPVKRAYTDEWVLPASEDEDFGESVYQVGYLGMYGLQGVLPDYFTDELLHLAEKNRPMRQFLDLFNQRFYQLLLQAWENYHFFNEDTLRPRNEHTKRQAVILDRLSGVLAGHSVPYMHGLRWYQMYLYRRSSRTIIGLQSILASFFPQLDIELNTFVAQYRRIPQDQFAIMGQNLTIGREGNFLVGSKIKDIGGTFEVKVKELGYDDYLELLPGGKLRRLMNELLENYTQGQWDTDLTLELRSDQIPQWELGNRSMGRDIWVHCLPMRDNALITTGALGKDVPAPSKNPGVTPETGEAVG